jgi:hypothetical protein
MGIAFDNEAFGRPKKRWNNDNVIIAEASSSFE